MRPPDDLDAERLRSILSRNAWLKVDERTPIRDVDVAYFDDSNLARERDDALAQQLRERRPEVPWEVTNQAGVHLWYETKFGFPIPPARSIEDAVGMWPETATAVAVRLQPDNSLYVVAPCGLTDLLGLRLRRNTRQVTHEFFQQRLREQRVQQVWPRVTVLDE